MTMRVWDSFLTDRDMELNQRRAKGEVGFGRLPALLLIDNYRNVLGDRPQPLLEAIEEWPASVGLSGWTAIGHIQKLLLLARKVGIPVVHVTSFPKDGRSVKGWSASIGKSQALKTVGVDGTSAGLAHANREDLFEIVEEVAPIDGEVVLRKAAPSCFFGTPLAAHLNHMKVDSLIIVGESTSGCVRATVVDAASHRYRVTVVEECVYDRCEASHAMNLFDMDQKYADVVPVEIVSQYLERYSPPADVTPPGRRAI